MSPFGRALSPISFQQFSYFCTSEDRQNTVGPLVALLTYPTPDFFERRRKDGAWRFASYSSMTTNSHWS